jgi:cytochrome c nitrite reductase small subunit
MPEQKRTPRDRVRTAWASLAPPPEWTLPVLLLLAVGLGLGGVTFHVSRASSYLSDNPQTCVNCHVMAPQFATWQNSRHRETATCNDCHVPHDNVLRHYAFKASDGARHAFMFTFRLEPQVIRIHPAGQRVVQENCVRCHGVSAHRTRLAEVPGDARAEEGEGLRCWACHRETPHGRVRGLAAVPYEHVPLPGRVTPAWLRDLMQVNPATPQQGRRDESR